ncbi:MAG TPA: aldose 1-epimerase family protein [Solirubrobacteraceae bacterium]
MSSIVPPSGEQHEIRHRDQRAVIVEVGGGLRRYETGAGPVLDGYGAAERCSGGRGQVLMPWPNRLRDGRYEWRGSTQQLPLSEPETGTAIHGLVRWAAWAVAERAEDRIVMAHRLHPQPGWPGTLDLRVEYRLGDDGLTVLTTAVNTGADACPYGAGFHPYLSLGVPSVDELILQVPARTRLEANRRGLPTGRSAIAGTELDYRPGRRIGEARLDDCFTDLDRDGDGRARVTLAHADRTAAVWVDQAFGYLMVFTGDTLAPERRRRGLAVEPMSCPPDALRSGEALVILEPGQTFTGAWGISTG